MLLEDKVVDRVGGRPGARPGQRPGAGPGGRDRRAGGPQRRLPRPGAGARSRRDGGRALAVPTNLVDAEQVAALVDAHGRRRTAASTCLVNNAFRMDTFQPFEAVDLVKWRKIFEVNVWGALGLTQACLPHLKKAAAEHGDASIVFIISMSMRKIRALEGGYSSSKAAVQTAAKTMAVELGPTGVRVNCVAPGWIGGPERRDVHPDGLRGARRRPRRRARRDRGAHPARPHPAAGRHREQVVFFVVAVVAGRHRPDARRQRR